MGVGRSVLKLSRPSVRHFEEYSTRLQQNWATISYDGNMFTDTPFTDFLLFVSNCPSSLICTFLSHIPTTTKFPELKFLSQDLLLGVINSDKGLAHLSSFYLLWDRWTMAGIYPYVSKLVINIFLNIFSLILQVMKASVFIWVGLCLSRRDLLHPRLWALLRGSPHQIIDWYRSLKLVPLPLPWLNLIYFWRGFLASSPPIEFGWLRPLLQLHYSSTSHCVYSRFFFFPTVVIPKSTSP